MTSFLTALCVLLSVLVLVLVCCLFSMRRAVRMLREIWRLIRAVFTSPLPVMNHSLRS